MTQNRQKTMSLCQTPKTNGNFQEKQQR
jgi:hypothetical protein